MIVDLSFSLSKLKTYSVFFNLYATHNITTRTTKIQKGRKQWRGGLKETI